ncbi:MAG: hypothetical protein GY760_16330 [Deltaproteobacteria bacterium]|nr:hypothetical protein [Deltaproteobacteria bacterium]
MNEDNKKKSLDYTEKWMGQSFARSGNYFFFMLPDELYEIAMEEYGDYLEEDWDFDNLIPVACVQEDYDDQEEQDSGHTDYWVFIDWSEDSNKPLVIVTGTDTWEDDEMVFDSIEELLNTSLY